MIIFRPHIFGETLEDSMQLAKEFKNEDEMKKYIYNLWNREKENFSMNDIVIDDRLITKDDRIGWEDTRYVSIKRYGDTDYITKYGSSQCIGYCATKYKKLQEVFNFQNLDRNSKENNGPVLTKKLTSLNK